MKYKVLNQLPIRSLRNVCQNNFCCQNLIFFVCNLLIKFLRPVSKGFKGCLWNISSLEVYQFKCALDFYSFAYICWDKMVHNCKNHRLYFL